MAEVARGHPCRVGGHPTPSRARQAGPMQVAALVVKRQALGAPRVRLPIAVPDRARHRVPARVRVLPLAPELRSLHRTRPPVRRLQNYAEALFHDARFWASVWNTAIIIAPALMAELLLGLGLALLLNRRIRARPIITALLAIPPMVSHDDEADVAVGEPHRLVHDVDGNDQGDGWQHAKGSSTTRSGPPRPSSRIPLTGFAAGGPLGPPASNAGKRGAA